jgi:hypothetical protein
MRLPLWGSCQRKLTEREKTYGKKPSPSRFARHRLLRFGHGSALTAIQAVIHYLAVASLPGVRGFGYIFLLSNFG